MSFNVAAAFDAVSLEARVKELLLDPIVFLVSSPLLCGRLMLCDLC